MGNPSGYNSYQSTNVGTADRGKLIIMIYDHCIKWCSIAEEDLASGNYEKFSKSIFKIQDGITELTCSLDMDNGGEIADNLFNLYSFYNRHLNSGLRAKDNKPIQEVKNMLTDLRNSWIEAIDIVRKEDHSQISDNSGNQIRMVG